mmetsp:Transcript_9234/g.24542  ORF Transcript_9234/g.24542 Transcript_9234/m.24542 type:complete len:265 (-) Transcript_9234:245-1039(-)
MPVCSRRSRQGAPLGAGGGQLGRRSASLARDLAEIGGAGHKPGATLERQAPFPILVQAGAQRDEAGPLQAHGAAAGPPLRRRLRGAAAGEGLRGGARERRRPAAAAVTAAHAAAASATPASLQSAAATAASARAAAAAARARQRPRARRGWAHRAARRARSRLGHRRSRGGAVGGMGRRGRAGAGRPLARRCAVGALVRQPGGGGGPSCARGWAPLRPGAAQPGRGRAACQYATGDSLAPERMAGQVARRWRRKRSVAARGGAL